MTELRRRFRLVRRTSILLLALCLWAPRVTFAADFPSTVRLVTCAPRSWATRIFMPLASLGRPSEALAPTTVRDCHVTLPEDGEPIALDLAPLVANAGDGPLAFASVRAAHGRTSIAGSLLSFTAEPDFFGEDRVEFTVLGSRGEPVPGSIGVEITPVNDPPSFSLGADLVVLEDSGQQVVPNWASEIAAGPPNEAGQRLEFEVSTTNPALFRLPPALSPDGALQFVPAPDANGSADMTVVLHDNGGNRGGGKDRSTVGTFAIRLTPVNDPPTFAKGDDLAVEEASPLRTVNGWATAISPGPPDEADQQVHFRVTAQRPELFVVLPTVSVTGALTFRPITTGVGTSVVTVQIEDDGGVEDGGSNSSPATSFQINVKPMVLDGDWTGWSSPADIVMTVLDNRLTNLELDVNMYDDSCTVRGLVSPVLSPPITLVDRSFSLAANNSTTSLTMRGTFHSNVRASGSGSILYRSPTCVLGKSFDWYADYGSMEIHVMNLDGSGRRPVTWNTSADYSPTWSPDGRQVAYYSHRGDDTPLFAVDVETKVERKLSRDDELHFDPDWSPDGRRIVYSGCCSDPYSSQIWVMDASGGNHRRLTRTNDDNEAPTWSADAQMIAFISGPWETADVYVMNAEGGGRRRLTRSTTMESSPAWSPDGKRIAFVSSKGYDMDSSEIYVMNADGSALIQLTKNTVWDDSPSWSPDGSQLLFITDREGGYYAMNADGSDQHPLAGTETGGIDPAWSPDGERIADSNHPVRPPSGPVLAATIAEEARRWPELGWPVAPVDAPFTWLSSLVARPLPLKAAPLAQFGPPSRALGLAHAARLVAPWSSPEWFRLRRIEADLRARESVRALGINAGSAEFSRAVR